MPRYNPSSPLLPYNTHHPDSPARKRCRHLPPDDTISQPLPHSPLRRVLSCISIRPSSPPLHSRPPQPVYNRSKPKCNPWHCNIYLLVRSTRSRYPRSWPPSVAVPATNPSRIQQNYHFLTASSTRYTPLTALFSLDSCSSQQTWWQPSPVV